MGKLQNRVALVTGGGRGIGRAVALALAQEGARVAVSARTESELAEVVSTIQSTGGTAQAFCADLAQKPACYRLADEVARKLGPIEILINNAGIGSSAHPSPIVDFPDDFWELTLALNLTAPYILSKAVLPSMLAKRSGRIIMMASINGRIPSVHGAAYTASKHGVLGLMRTLAMEVAKEGITVNAVCPGPVHTVMNDRRLAYDAARKGLSVADLEAGLTPIGGRLEPEDIAPITVYLASDDAKMVTGQAFNICGGIALS